MKICRLLLLLFTSLWACKKEGAKTQEPKHFEDLPFEIGKYDEFDYHLTYNPPKQVINLEWDLDQDSEADLYFGAYNRQIGGFGNEWGLELRSLSSKEWRILGTDYRDSVFFCGNSPDPYDGFIYNRHSILVAPCPEPLDSFVKVKAICRRPKQFRQGEAWPKEQLNWDQQVFYDFTHALQSPPTYLVFNGTESDTLSHYLLLENRVDTSARKAWIKVHRKIYRSSGQVLVYIEELAVQALGRD